MNEFCKQTVNIRLTDADNTEIQEFINNSDEIFFNEEKQDYESKRIFISAIKTANKKQKLSGESKAKIELLQKSNELFQSEIAELKKQLSDSKQMVDSLEKLNKTYETNESEIELLKKDLDQSKQDAQQAEEQKQREITRITESVKLPENTVMSQLNPWQRHVINLVCKKTDIIQRSKVYSSAPENLCIQPLDFQTTSCLVKFLWNYFMMVEYGVINRFDVVDLKLSQKKYLQQLKEKEK
jgi:predicted RNase H-like nuclease (RuvC/YqgF family)